MQKEQLGLNSAARSALSQASRAVLSLLFGTLRDSRETGRRLCPSPPGLLGLMGG